MVYTRHWIFFFFKTTIQADQKQKENGQKKQTHGLELGVARFHTLYSSHKGKKNKNKQTKLTFQTINTFTTNKPVLLCGGGLAFMTDYGCENLYDSLLSKAHSLSTNKDYEESTSCNEELRGGNTKGTANRVKHSLLSPR